MRSHWVYGYILNQNIELRITSGLMINIKDGRIKKLSDTNLRLLRFLIEGEQNGRVSDDDIAAVVFESAGLKSSSSRTRGAIGELKEAFRETGFHPDFISRYVRHGYYVHFDSVELLIASDNYRAWLNDSFFYTGCDNCRVSQSVICGP